MNIFWFKADELFTVVSSKLKKVEVVLDIGCGIRPQELFAPLVHICCEPYDQYVEKLVLMAKDEYVRSYVIIKATWAETVKLFPPKSVDTVFLVDVIEHLDKTEAAELLKATERLARNQVAIFTPLGFTPQFHTDGKDAWGLDGADWQEHRSGWNPDDFDETWDIYAAREFHAKDSMGNVIYPPYGAFWAVKTLPEPNVKDIEVYSRKDKQRVFLEIAVKTKSPRLFDRVHAIATLAAEIAHEGMLDRIACLMNTLLNIKNSKLNDYRRRLLRIFGIN